jgi:SAM-dependent methyltransferase
MIRLLDRPRLRRAIGLGGRRALLAVTLGADFARELSPAPLANENQSATRTLYERLDPENLEEVERRVAAAADLGSSDIDRSDPAHRALVLAYGMWLGVASVAENTGLSMAQPPEEVHSMADGPLAAAGGLYEADLVVDALASAGVEIAEVDTALDFGCSSGRVARVLAACYPAVRWIGCDPNERAVAWAAENLPGIEFFVSPQEPPLPYDNDSLDLVYAVSIWSHFEPERGLRWFDEMHRLVRPGGHLVFTTHGVASIAFYATERVRSPRQADLISGALYRRGCWYRDEFGRGGDWGVTDASWGTAFLSPEWVLTKLCPRWRVLEFAPGRNQANQDVYVLQRA